MFVGDPNFKPAIVGVPEQKLRELMLLDVTDTDYYLKAYLSVLEGYPDILALADEVSVSYSMRDIPPRGVEMDGAEFYAKINSVGYFTDQAPTSFPVPLTYRITFIDSLNLKIAALETGIVRVVSYQKSGVDPNETLRVEWPEDIPFKGPLSLLQTWNEGAMVEISVTPSAFPYDLLAKRIQGNPWLTRLLVNNRLVDEYTAVPDSQRKVAIAAIVLALSNPSVYPETNG